MSKSPKLRRPSSPGRGKASAPKASSSWDFMVEREAVVTHLRDFKPRDSPRKREQHSASETNVSARLNEKPESPIRIQSKPRSGQGDDTPPPPISSPPTRDYHRQSPPVDNSANDHLLNSMHQARDLVLERQRVWKEKNRTFTLSKKSRSCSPAEETPMARQIRDLHSEMRSSARIIKDSRVRLLELQRKPVLSEVDVKELGDRHDLLLREMERFERLTRSVQQLVAAEASHARRKRVSSPLGREYVSVLDKPVHHEMIMHHPSVVLSRMSPEGFNSNSGHSKSEIDLTRKLSESYDMQEKLVADNADLEVKRYILYKELMTKDQNLETCRSQVKRLQGELKLMSKENALLHERLNKCNSEIKDHCEPQELVEKLEKYRTFTVDLEKQLGGLELEVRHARVEMDQMKQIKAVAEGKEPPPLSPACGARGSKKCYSSEGGGGPPAPPLTKACGSCPPCPAPCNPDAPPTPAEREVSRLSNLLQEMEGNFKIKVTECAMLRTELMKAKEELQKERCQHRELQAKYRELEMRYQGLQTNTNMMLGTKEEAFENEMNIVALKRCYREAHEEIDELRTLIKEQNEQLQEYRVKYMQAQQLVEEQKRQMDMMDMDNTRISEQINLEIQRIKLKFQEKLQELTPIPDLLKATQMRLKDAQQSQALAEHNAEQLARELNIARERVHMMLHNAVKPPEKDKERGGNPDEKQMAILNQRITQLTETNQTLKQEIERLKTKVIRMEEAVLANEKRLQEKMHECAQLGGELDRSRDEAARALARANERQETIKKCLQTTIAELERQLAMSRALVKTGEREREELQNRMQCQIKRLNENFEQAQLRIMGLQTQVNNLRHATSSTGDGGDGDDPAEMECLCRSMLDKA